MIISCFTTPLSCILSLSHIFYTQFGSILFPTDNFLFQYFTELHAFYKEFGFQAIISSADMSSFLFPEHLDFSLHSISFPRILYTIYFPSHHFFCRHVHLVAFEIFPEHLQMIFSKRSFLSCSSTALEFRSQAIIYFSCTFFSKLRAILFLFIQKGMRMR